MAYAVRVHAGKRPNLDQLDPSESHGLTKEQGKEQLAKLAAEIGKLQELMYAAKKTALLCIFQGRDTSGKDGAINRILSYINVQSCNVAYFKQPTSEELAHDFLWRVHPHVPGRGGATMFNRSHYEDVLAVRVHKLVPDHVWKKRYEAINQFEKLIADNETIILKFLLHISKEEQEERLLAREQDPAKSWKLAVGDWKERELWHDYTEAFEDALEQCNTDYAPWLVIPANRKWYRDLAIAEAIAESLRPYKDEWMDHLKEQGQHELAAIQEYRASQTS